MMRLRFAAFAAATLLACSTAPAAEVKGRVLTGAEIQTEIIGNTISGVDDGNSYDSFLRDDGRVRGNGYFGEWHIAADTLCFDYKGTRYDGCWGMALDGANITWLKNGMPDGTGRLTAGNPKGL